MKFTAHLLLLAMILAPMTAFAEEQNSEPVELDTVSISLAAMETEAGDVKLTWEVLGETPNGFKVLRSQTNADLSYPTTEGTTAAFTTDKIYTDSAVEASTAYHFRVCAYNGTDGNHGCSNVVSLTTSELAETPETDPATIVLDAVLTDEGLVLEWTPEGDTSKGFKIVKSKLNTQPTYPTGENTEAVFVGAETDRYVFGSPTGGYTHYLRVCAYDGNGGNNGCSNVEQVVVPQSEGSDNEEAEDTADADIELEATLNEHGVVLEWDVDGDVSKGQKILWSKTNAELTYPPASDTTGNFVGADARRYVFEHPVAGKTYYLRVCAYNGSSGNNGCSNVVKVEVPSDYDGGDDKDYNKDPQYKEGEKKGIGTNPEYHELIAQIKELKKQVRELRKAFKDVVQHRFLTAIDYLREQGIVEGYEDGSFKPDNKINRAEFMKIVMEKYYEDMTGEARDCFDDVVEEWFAPYVCLGKIKGIIHGYSDGHFQPGKNISFVEAAKILVNVYGLELGEEGDDWYESFVLALQENNYIPDTIESLDQPITRAEMAELIWRIKEGMKDQADADLL